MIEYYLPVRSTHIVSAIASGTLFLLRGTLVQAGRPDWALAPVTRYASYAIDTTLLTAALMLVAMLPAALYENGWLATKLALLPVYIGLGWFALRGEDRRLRLASFAGAALAYGSMFAIARAHDPLGPFQLWSRLAPG